MGYLSAGAMNLLRRMAGIEGDDDVIVKPELIREQGAGWWLGNHQTSSRYAVELTRLCVVKLEWGKVGDYEIWTINHDGESLLVNPEYVPRIVAAQTEARHSGRGKES